MKLPHRRNFLHLAAGKATNCDDCHVGQKGASLVLFLTILATERENGNAAMNAYKWFLLGMMVAFAQ